MTTVRLLGLVMAIGMTGVSAGEQQAKSAIVLASQAGAALDSDLMKGGGTDDTAALQRILDRAKSGRAVHLVIDGPAVVTGLDVYGNTSIECTAGGGLYLRDKADRAIIRNANPSREKVIDEHITIRGCVLNGNRDGQRRSYDPQRDDAVFKSGLQFFGVNDLTIENVTLSNIRSFGAWIANAKVISIRNVTVDSGLPPYPGAGSITEQREYWEKYRSNIDGIHFNGPIQYLTLDGLKVFSEDDALALNANDMFSDDMTIKNEMGPYVGQGPITDVTISNVVLMDALQGIRLLSRDQRIDRIVIQNVTGTIRHHMVVLSPFAPTPETSRGNFGTVMFSNIAVKPAKSAAWPQIYPEYYEPGGPWYADEQGELPLFSVNGAIENLNLQHVATQAIDARPLIRIGPYAAVQTMNVSMSLSDPPLQSVPLKLVAGGHIERLKFSLDWKGEAVDVGKNPIQYNGGTVEQLHWVDTPPMYVSAEVAKADSSVVAVAFSQILKDADWVTGVEIRVNGKAARVLSTVRLEAGEAVQYRLGAAVKPGESVTWAYEAAKGSLQNLNGDHMLSVPEKVVVHDR